MTKLCQSASYSCTTGGYKGQDVWRVYGAPHASHNAYGPHNCTLYAAYRLSVNGVKYPGWSRNARDWDDAAKAQGTRVNTQPAVGAIAVWNYGTTGHVAYVEKISYNHIEVSEDNYGINYTRRERITKQSPGWPDQFIHFKDLTTSARAGHGDVNRDSLIDIFDLSIFLSHYGSTSWTPGDLNHDGVVNIFDLSILLSHYGT